MRKHYLLTAVLTAAMLTGCSSSAPEGQSQEPKAESGAAEETVIVNYYGRPDDNGVESAIVAAFEESHPNIKINYVELPDSSNDRLKTINTVLQAGDSSIDVFASDVTWPPIFASAGWVIPLDEYLEAGELDAYLEGPLSAFQFRGANYGLPFMADCGALYYRKDLLDKYGKDVPETWAEIMETGREIAEQEGGRMSGFVSYWMQNESLTCAMLEYYWEKGGEVIDEEGKSVLDEALLTETLAQMREAIESGAAAAGTETFGTTEARNVVTAGNAVFARDWLSGYVPYNNEETSSVAGNMEITSLPSFGTLGGWGVMVSAYSANKEEAVEFAKFRASEEAQMIADDLADITPTLKAAYEDGPFLEKKPDLPKFLPVLENSRPRPQSPFYAEISGIMQLEIHSVITGMTTPEEGAANITQQVAQGLQ